MADRKRILPQTVPSTNMHRRQFLNGALAVLGGVSAASLTSTWPRVALAQKPLLYGIWPWGNEVVNSNLKVFEKQYNEKVQLQIIPGEYTSVIETKLASKAPLDMFRAQRGQAARWYAAGWIRPVDDLPGLEEIQADMFPSLVEDATAPDGRYLGLTYYNGGPFCVFRNEKVLGAAGYEATGNPADYPQTWDDVYKQAVEIKKKGIVEYPILPCWYKAWTGLPWGLMSHGFSEGEYFVGPDLKATFSADTPFLKVLTDWRQWYKEGLVPPGLFSWQEGQMSSSWMAGNHAFHYYLDLFSFVYADPESSSIAEHNNQNPVFPGQSQDTVLVGHALLAMSNRSRSDEELMRIWNLMRFEGYKDKNGDFRVAKSWVKKANYPVQFPGVYDDPEIKEAVMKWMYPPTASQQYQWLFDGRARAMAPNMLKAPWYQEWEPVMHDMISEELLVKGSKSPKEVVTELRNHWDKLYAKYN